MLAIIRTLLLVLAGLAASVAQAAYNCTVSSPGFVDAYDPTAATATIVSTSFTINCTRALSDAASMTWTNAANNGLHPTGGSRNRAQSAGGSRINYDVYRDGACGTQWRSGGNAFTGTLAFGGSTTASTTVTYWACIPASQTGLPAGTYNDTVTMTLTYGPFSTTATGTFGAAIATPATCNLTTAPGNVVFNYTGFGAVANASTTYAVTCTTFLAYSMALDATGGTILGVNYTLALTAASGTGNGAAQSYGINGAIAAGQAGTCATGTCTASQGRTLTITY